MTRDFHEESTRAGRGDVTAAVGGSTTSKSPRPGSSPPGKSKLSKTAPVFVSKRGTMAERRAKQSPGEPEAGAPHSGTREPRSKRRGNKGKGAGVQAPESQQPCKYKEPSHDFRCGRRSETPGDYGTVISECGKMMIPRCRDENKGMAANNKLGGGRMFGGSLTKDADSSRGGAGANDGDNKAVSRTEACSSSGDLSSTLARRLTNSTYECMICCDKVRPRHAVWHCDKCWAIFHIGCVRKWVKSSTEDPSAHWRCPGCQNTRGAVPSHYVCFCGATVDPEPVRGCTPHSCGQVCGRNRGSHCPHPCPLPCHPGPCPPCTAMAPEQFCFCGQFSYQPRCGAKYDPVDGVKSCGAVCGEMLGCGKHACEQPCHSGLCQPCAEEEEQLCYCGKHSRTAKCGAGRPIPTFITKDTGDDKVTEPATGHYACDGVCSKLLGCGIHRCEKPCHPRQDPLLSHGPCPMDPERATTCHCGKEQAAELGDPRTKCTDPVPSCNKECRRQLASCTHRCKETCHDGPCPPCKVMVSSSCRCGAKAFQIECHKARGHGEELRCNRVCSKKRACRRHQCLERCCPSDHTDVGGVVVPSERIEPDTVDPHQCTQECDRMLHCKNHRCTGYCHRGACPPCQSVSYEELSCACGRTRLYPPIPCGKMLPPCRYPCERIRECGHFTLATHECHPDSVACPPCPVLVTTQCMCGAKEMKTVPCHRRYAASCGSICNKLLPCGGHRCQRSCHRPDEPCLRGQACRQTCKKPRKTCGHPCALLCHSPAMCDESRACETLVTTTCVCGRISAQEICGATVSNQQSAAARKFPCNELCRIAERNRRLALALDLKDRAEEPLAGLVRATYPEELLGFARSNLAWTRDIEGKAAAFIGDRTRTALMFAPMKQPLRAFLHALGPFYGCKSQSVDYEPKRSVCWERTTRTTIPSIVLSGALSYTRAPQIICSDQINAGDDHDFDDTASHVFDSVAGSTNIAADRLRRKIDFLAISDLRHGLVVGELKAEIDRLLPSAPYAIRWVGEDQVEMYCTDTEAKNEYLTKWEAMLRSKLPLLGIAGLVKGEKSAADTPKRSRSPTKRDAGAEDTATNSSTNFWESLAT
ncbi:FKBP12-associated protein [Coemansia sp. RSA 552]|nr:FKBP12-associated protein [Coemansia sp. RSA 552]